MACMKQFYYFEATNNDQCQRTTCNTAKLNMFAEFAYSLRTFFASDSFSFLFVCARVDCFFSVFLLFFMECYFLLTRIFLSFIRDLCIAVFSIFIFLLHLYFDRQRTNYRLSVRRIFFFFDARSNAVHRLFALQFILLYFFLSLI